MGFLKTAERVLAAAKAPLHYREITRRASDEGWLPTEGLTPWATMNAQIAVALKRDGDAGVFVRVRPGVFGLRAWLENGLLGPEALIAASGGQSLVPHFPIYENSRAVLPAWVGARKSAITGARAAVNALRGTPQSQEDWTDPDSWITERLSGEAQEWARCTWEGSGRRVNPRHTTGHWLLATNYGLLQEDSDGLLTITERGRDFLQAPAGQVVQEIDEAQGLARVLALVADSGSASRSDLLGPWGEYLLSETNIRSESATKAHLWARLRNLSSRKLVERSGRAYAITPEGLDYLQFLGGSTSPEVSEEQQLRRLLREQQERVREGIRDLLADMDPFAFEHLIRQLLEEIGYEDVEVTSASNDKGVDVVGRIELGITSVREVVQVKRHKANIQRPVLDGLRGALHRFDAVRGTIITIGGFSKGTTEAAFESGAAPITLINGEKLVELLIEHGIGVKKRSIETWELDADAFLGDSQGDGDEIEQAD